MKFISIIYFKLFLVVVPYNNYKHTFFIGEITSNVLRVAREARQRTLGPFSPSFNVQEILLESLQKVHIINYNLK